jgi:histidinol-phosphate aminotransferase
VKNRRCFIRPLVQRLHAYVPGEQPKIKGLIKLNTNENPYPPSPRVLKVVKAAVDGRLRLYPNPTAQPLREKLAKFHRCKPDNIIVGNGSDELLALATRALVEPLARGLSGRSGLAVSAARRTLSRLGKVEISAANMAARRSDSTVQYFTPSYSLYPVLADIHGALRNPVPVKPDFSMPTVKELQRDGRWDFRAALTFITAPNAPSGRGYSTAEVEALCRAQKGVVILDEAYVDFADENALTLAVKYPHVIVSRTFSKAYSLCFQRVGYFVGHPELIAALDKIRDSYNVNGLGQVAAMTTLDDLAYYRGNFKRIIATRERVARELTMLGFRVLPSQTNFLFVRPPAFSAREWLQKLRDRKILVRWFNCRETEDYLRITVGSEPEMEAFLKAARKILSR